MNKIRISALSILLVVGQASVNGATLFNNIADAGTDSITLSSAPSTIMGAQRFNSGTADTLTSLQLNLFNSGGASGTFFVSLYNVSGIHPGSSVGTISASTPVPTATDSANLVTLSGLTVSLTPGVDYFVVIGLNSEGSGVKLGQTSTVSSTFPGDTFLSFSGGWTVGEETQFRMLVEGVTAVPEPAGYMGASLLALFGLGHFGRRYLRRKSAAQA